MPTDHAQRPRPSRPGCNRTLARAGSDMRDLAIPQLLLSSACAIVLTMNASPIAVFPHRGLAPHQFTPMSGAHRMQRTPRIASRFQTGCQWRGVAEPVR